MPYLPLDISLHHPTHKGTTQESICSLSRCQEAFATVWHEGLFIKLHNKGLPMRMWHLLHTWYKKSSCSVAWNNATSASFPICQGVRQGAILSPLLYSIFVDEFLDLLFTSGLGVRVNSIYIGAPMYADDLDDADDLALIAESPQELQAMLNIVHSYAGKWRYNLNASKSFFMVPPFKNSSKILTGMASGE